MGVRKQTPCNGIRPCSKEVLALSLDGVRLEARVSHCWKHSYDQDDSLFDRSLSLGTVHRVFEFPGWQRWAVLLGALLLPATKEGENAVAFVQKQAFTAKMARNRLDCNLLGSSHCFNFSFPFLILPKADACDGKERRLQEEGDWKARVQQVWLKAGALPMEGVWYGKHISITWRQLFHFPASKKLTESDKGVQPQVHRGKESAAKALFPPP